MAGAPAADLHVDILVIGAGPTGLGAASRLFQHRHQDWLLLDAFPGAGGLSRSELTSEGFCFDMGGHVIFSHYKYFDQLLDYAMGTGPDIWSVIERVSYVWIKNRYVPYPFQNNLSVLDVEDQIKCLEGLVEANMKSQVHRDPPTNFDEWMVRVMGEGITDMFMRPYNFKVWAIPATHMQWEWLGERTTPIDVKEAMANVLRGVQTPAPTTSFRFPRRGGTGAIWEAVAQVLPQDKIRYNSRVTALDGANKIVTLQDGVRIKFRHCISTMPLDYTLRLLGNPELAGKLFYSSSHVIGIGLRGHMPHGKKAWLYYPEDNCPFYRATCFSNYAKENCPEPHVRLRTLRVVGDPNIPPGEPEEGPYWSLMFEVSESPLKRVNKDTIIEDTIAGAVAVGLLRHDDQIVSIYHRRLPHGFPTPTTIRDVVLAEALPKLKKLGIWSRGRFGTYKYEVANQDHSLIQGVEAVDNILFGTQETTLNHPSLIASTKNNDLVFIPPEDAHQEPPAPSGDLPTDDPMTGGAAGSE